MVHAHHQRGNLLGTLGRGRDEHALRPSLHMKRGLFELGEEAGGLKDILHAQVLPRELCRVLHRHGLGRAAVNRERAACVAGDRRDIRRLVPHLHPAVNSVVLEQIRKVVRGNKIVHGNELNPLLETSPEHQATDATETIDADADGHVGPFGGGANDENKNSARFASFVLSGWEIEQNPAFERRPAALPTPEARKGMARVNRT